MSLFAIEIVGGPFDGYPSLAMRLEPEAEPPGRIFLGVCPGRTACNSTDCTGKGHVAWWTDVEDVPVETVRYERERFEHGEDVSKMMRKPGTATYVFGGLGSLRSLREFVDSEAERELLTAGSA